MNSVVAPPGPPIREQARLLRGMFTRPQPVLDELRSRYGPVVALGAGPLRMVIIGEPEILASLFGTPTEAFRWNHRFNVLGFVVGKQSMIVSDGEDHRRRRRSVQSAFSRRRLNRWIPMILDRTDRAIDDLLADPGRLDAPVDLYPWGRSLVLGIVVEAFFGADMTEHTAEIGRLMQGPQDYLEGPAIRQLPHPFPWGAREGVRRDRRALDAIIDEAIRRRRARADTDPDDVLDVLVTDDGLTDDEIRDQVVTLIGAGYDTTAATLAWLGLRAAGRPEVWHRLRAEAGAVFPSPLAEADAQTLSRLTYAERVVRESLRLHPAGVLSPREAARDLVLGDYRIRRGTMIAWSPHLAGRDPSVWSEPLEFDPSRWDSMTPEQEAITDSAWVPFGGGARNCIGFALARMELTLIVSRLAQRVELRPAAETVPDPVGMVVNRPAGGAPMLVSPAGALG